MSRTSADTVESLTTGFVTPRVNLLPPEVHQARKLRRLQIGLGAGVAAVAVVVGGLWFVESRSAQDAQESLASAQAQESQLNAQKAQYADVPRTLAQIESAEDARQTAMQYDVQWYRYLNDLSYITPKSAWLTQLTLTFNNGGAATNPIAHDSIATLSISGSAKQHINVASWLDALSKEKGFADPYFTNSTKSEVSTKDAVNFTSSVNVTPDALSHRYDRKAG